jgi:hypothetical protein
LRGAAVWVDFGEGGAALGVEVALDFHEALKLGQGYGGRQGVWALCGARRALLVRAGLMCLR